MVLVTGGTGFLGAYIIKNLAEKGIPVRAVRRSDKLPSFIPGAVFQNIEWVEGDILDVVFLDDVMQGVDAVVHAAALVSFSKKNRQEMYKINVEGTSNVVNAAIAHQVQRLVHISSVAALGRSTTAESVSEEKSWEDNKNQTHYAISKYHAEIEVWRGFSEGLEGVIINPSTILGYGDWHQSSCAIFKNVYKEFPWFTRGTNGFVGVEDVAESAVQLLWSEISSKRFIVNAENISFQHLFNMIADGFGKQRPNREATPLLGEMAWRMEAVKSVFTHKKPLLTKETAKVAHSKTSFTNKALLEALPGFSYAPLSIVVKNACEQYLEALQKGQLTL